MISQNGSRTILWICKMKFKIYKIDGELYALGYIKYPNGVWRVSGICLTKEPNVLYINNPSKARTMQMPLEDILIWYHEYYFEKQCHILSKEEIDRIARDILEIGDKEIPLTRCKSKVITVRFYNAYTRNMIRNRYGDAF